jgi:type IV pilus assembly protein PilC
MMKAGVPLLQAFDIVGRGNANPSVAKLLNDIRTDVETGTSLSAAFRKYPIYFDNLYCNLVEAGETAGILEQLLDRLAVYMEKTEAIKSKIKSALMYPISVVVVAFVVVAVIMIFVIPAFKQVFSSFGADLPGADAVRHRHERVLRQVLVADLRRDWRWAVLLHASLEAQRESPDASWTGFMLKVPVFGVLIEKSVHRALDSHSGHHVRRWRAAGRGARFSGRRLRAIPSIPSPLSGFSRRSLPAPA